MPVLLQVELPHPGEAARAQIMRIHSKKMKVDLEDVNFEELARCTEDFNGAQMKAVAVESGMIALRRLVSVLVVVLCNSCNRVLLHCSRIILLIMILSTQYQ